MIRSITRKKSDDEINNLLEGMDRVFIIGCGTCTTLTCTGGEPEVSAMTGYLSEQGKFVTGSTVLPVACDNLTNEAMNEFRQQIEQADALVIMSCAFGVQNVSRQIEKMVIPALDTMFLGKETDVGQYDEICSQCGTCIIGETGGICPVTSCHKGLVNGPCGGTDNGSCEIDSKKDCAWTNIYERLDALGKLDSMKKYQKPRNHQGEPTPGKYEIEV
ncbi:methylenetetrahydrofolate reductase C-terminal domain-containing protein [Thermodesulfobacteriota bacterium]